MDQVSIETEQSRTTYDSLKQTTTDSHRCSINRIENSMNKLDTAKDINKGQVISALPVSLSTDSLTDILPVRDSVEEKKSDAISKTVSKAGVDGITSDETEVKHLKESIAQTHFDICHKETESLPTYQQKSVGALTSRYVLPTPALCCHAGGGTDCLYIYDRPHCAIHKSGIDASTQKCPSHHNDEIKEISRDHSRITNQSVGLVTSIFCNPCHTYQQTSDVMSEMLSPKVYKALYEKTKRAVKKESSSKSRKSSFSKKSLCGDAAGTLTSRCLCYDPYEKPQCLPITDSDRSREKSSSSGNAMQSAGILTSRCYCKNQPEASSEQLIKCHASLWCCDRDSSRNETSADCVPVLHSIAVMTSQCNLDPCLNCYCKNRILKQFEPAFSNTESVNYVNDKNNILESQSKNEIQHGSSANIRESEAEMPKDLINIVQITKFPQKEYEEKLLNEDKDNNSQKSTSGKSSRCKKETQDKKRVCEKESQSKKDSGHYHYHMTNTVTIDDNRRECVHSLNLPSWFEEYDDDNAKSNLIESCRYYSSLLTKQLGRLFPDNLSIRLALPSDKAAKLSKTEHNSVACTMVPSGRHDLACQTTRTRSKHNRSKSSRNLSHAFSLTNISRGAAERENLKSIYYVLTAMEGRIRRIKKCIPT